MPNYRKVARRKARKYGIDARIFERQINQESGFAPDVITGRRSSPAGAQGIAQIMPDTARGWGVDPLKPRQALDAAARNMADYVKKYGGYENALRAYNAGPGNIERSRDFAETNNYVASILNGSDPKSVSAPRGSSSQGGPRYKTETIPGVDRSQERQLLKLSYLENRRGPNALLTLAAGIRQAQDTPAKTRRVRVKERPKARVAVRPARGKVRGRPNAQGSPGQLLEMFYNGPGGINVDNGKQVGKGFVEGHTGNVHVAADPKTIRAIARLGQDMGVDIRELEGFDQVDPVHTDNSYHYRRMALDANGTSERLRAFNREVARRFGIGA